MIGIGFSGSKASLERIPGWEPESWGYHGDDGKSHCCGTAKHYGPTYSTSDVIGCGVNFTAGCAFYTKNGVFLGEWLLDVRMEALLMRCVRERLSGSQRRPTVPIYWDEKARSTSECELRTTAIRVRHRWYDGCKWSPLCHTDVAWFLLCKSRRKRRK